MMNGEDLFSFNGGVLSLPNFVAFELEEDKLRKFGDGGGSWALCFRSDPSICKIKVSLGFLV